MSQKDQDTLFAGSAGQDTSHRSTPKSPPPREEEPPRRPKVEVLEPHALQVLGVRNVGEIEQELSLIDELTMMEKASELFDRRAALLAQARESAIRRTSPQDWVLFKDKGGNVTGMLCKSGAEKVADIYGIQIYNLRPLGQGSVFEPRMEKDGEEVRYYGWLDAVSLVTGRRVESIEFGRSSSEDFIGRAAISSTSTLVKKADLKAAMFSNGRTKAVRIICAMSNVPGEELQACGIDVEKCRKGSGYGTSTERGASSVTTDDVKETRNKLGEEILARVGGDAAAAADLLKEITANPNAKPKAFPGFDSIGRITKDWQVENAWKKLREHPTFGDAEQGGGASS